jgi:hypothetical protein
MRSKSVLKLGSSSNRSNCVAVIGKFKRSLFRLIEKYSLVFIEAFFFWAAQREPTASVSALALPLSHRKHRSRHGINFESFPPNAASIRERLNKIPCC